MSSRVDMAKTVSTGNSKRGQSKKRRLSIPEDKYAEAGVVARPHSATLHCLHPRDVAPLRFKLLEWFAGVRDVRGMPWRQPVVDAVPETRAQRAYEVWVSEIMLQQTQVATVIPYYTRWMKQFPTIRALADADIDTVNSLWKGLGYYSRAARLLSGAQKVVAKFDGRLPADVKTMEKEIPGIGRYSAGAICSIAYGICAPVLDGNVHRLLSRVLALHAYPKAKKALDLLWNAAEVMVENSDQPGDVNQALIELGSTVCKIRDPICDSCPLKDGCGAYKEYKMPQSSSGDIEDACDVCEPVSLASGKSVTRFPMRAIKMKSRRETDAINIVEWRDDSERYFVLVRRPEGGLLAGLYEFPSCENVDENETDLLEVPRSILGDLLASPPPKHPNANDTLRITAVHHIGDIVHIFSHIRKTYKILWVVLQGGSSPPSFSDGSRYLTKRRKTDIANPSGVGARVKWVTEEQVADANIGTGVLNVWKKARSFWNSSKK